MLLSSKRESGQTMTEYAVILAVISAGVLVALTAFSGAVVAAIERVAGFLV